MRARVSTLAPAIVTLALGGFLMAGTSGAAEQLLLGKVLQVKDPSSAATKRAVKVMAKELLSSATLVGSPLIGGATLRVIAHGASGSEQTFSLPAAGWLPTPTGFRYRDKPGDYGPVKVAVLKKTPTGLFLLKVVATGELGAITILPPNPGTDGGAIFSIAGGDTYCANFGGAAGGLVVNTPPGNAFKKFKISRPTAATPCLASPSGAFLDASAALF